MKIICIGRNYADHIAELGNERPESPVIFLKPDTALLRNNEPFHYPSFSEDIHYEVEVLVKIKREGKSIEKDFASNYYEEIGLGVDLTARDLQAHAKNKGLPWDLAKGFNGSAPISSFISKNGHDLKNLEFTLELNGEKVQKGNTNLMLCPIDEIISYVSKFITLKTGDIIFTGTPQGVGPIKIGDRLKGFIGDKEMFNFEVR